MRAHKVTLRSGGVARTRTNTPREPSSPGQDATNTDAIAVGSVTRYLCVLQVRNGGWKEIAIRNAVWLSFFSVLSCHCDTWAQVSCNGTPLCHGRLGCVISGENGVGLPLLLLQRCYLIDIINVSNNTENTSTTWKNIDFKLISMDYKITKAKLLQHKCNISTNLFSQYTISVIFSIITSNLRKKVPRSSIFRCIQVTGLSRAANRRACVDGRTFFHCWRLRNRKQMLRPLLPSDRVRRHCMALIRTKGNGWADVSRIFQIGGFFVFLDETLFKNYLAKQIT